MGLEKAKAGEIIRMDIRIFMDGESLVRGHWCGCGEQNWRELSSDSAVLSLENWVSEVPLRTYFGELWEMAKKMISLQSY